MSHHSRDHAPVEMKTTSNKTKPKTESLLSTNAMPNIKRTNRLAVMFSIIYDKKDHVLTYVTSILRACYKFMTKGVLECEILRDIRIH
jgi:hypothetical protein